MASVILCNTHTIAVYVNIFSYNKEPFSPWGRPPEGEGEIPEEGEKAVTEKSDEEDKKTPRDGKDPGEPEGEEEEKITN